MRCLSLSKGIWIERLPAKVSEEEKSVLTDHREENRAERKRIVDEIRTRALRPAGEEDANAAQSVYDLHMVEGAELIAANVILPGLHGSINCRIGTQYKYIRF